MHILHFCRKGHSLPCEEKQRRHVEMKVLGKTSYCNSCACYHKMSLNLLYKKKIILEAKNPRHAVITDQLVRGRASEICSQFGKITESLGKNILL